MSNFIHKGLRSFDMDDVYDFVQGCQWEDDKVYYPDGASYTITFSLRPKESGVSGPRSISKGYGKSEIQQGYSYGKDVEVVWKFKTVEEATEVLAKLNKRFSLSFEDL